MGTNLSTIAPTIHAPLRHDISTPFSSSRSEDEGWRQLTGRQARDLPPYTQDRMIALSFSLYRQNPMAKRLVDLKVDFVLGNGIRILSEHDQTRKAIMDWWLDPYNAWPRRLHQKLKDLIIYGEWLHIPVINERSGRTWMTSAQPSSISRVVPSASDAGVPEIIVLKRMLRQDGTLQDEAPIRVIRPTYNADGLATGFGGDAFLFGINMTSDNLRGVGDLFTLVDYLDLYDEILYNRAEKIAAMSAVWFDLKLEGYTQEQIEAYLDSEVGGKLPPRPGALYAHNEKAELKANSPQLHADDHSADAGVIKSHIVSSAGYPGTFFDDPGTAGRAVGAEMSEPTFRSMTSFQGLVREFLKAEIDYALWALRRAGTLTEDPGEYHISMQRPTNRDIARIGPAMFRLSQAIEVLIAQGVIDNKQARAIVASQVNQLSISDVPFSMELPLVRPEIPIQRNLSKETGPDLDDLERQ